MYLNANIEAIVAVDQKNGIAKNGKIPWKCKKDMNFFKSKTINNIVIMGSITFFSLPNQKPLKDRLNIVVTRKPEIYENKDNLIFMNEKNVLTFIKTPTIFNFQEKYKFLKNDYTIFIIGGDQIYSIFMPYCSIIWFSKLKIDYECDIYLSANIKDFTHKENEYEDDELVILKLQR